MAMSRRISIVIEADAVGRGVAAVSVVLDAIDRHLDLERDSDRLPDDVRDAVKAIRRALWELTR